MPPDLALLSTLIGSNYPYLELIFMAPKVFEPLKFDCIFNFGLVSFLSKQNFTKKNFNTFFIGTYRSEQTMQT